MSFKCYKEIIPWVDFPELWCTSGHDLMLKNYVDLEANKKFSW